MEKVVVQLSTGGDLAEVYGTVYLMCDTPWGREFYQWAMSGELPGVGLSARQVLRTWEEQGLMAVSSWCDVDGWRRVL